MRILWRNILWRERAALRSLRIRLSYQVAHWLIGGRWEQFTFQELCDIKHGRVGSKPSLEASQELERRMGKWSVHSR